jgi:flavin-dependent dehydrogenase
MYDMVIVGLGPAGSSLARLLDKKFKILAIDRKNQAGPGFEKPCGGLLATDAQKYLSKLNLTLPLSVMVDPQIFTVKTIDVNKNLIRHYQRFYMNLDRHKFDLWLESIIPQNVEIVDNAVCTAVSKLENSYKVEYFKDGEVKSVLTRYIIGADGANSKIRRTFYPGKKIRCYLAIQEWYQDEQESPFYSCVFDNSITDCYSWSISKGGNLILGGAFPVKKAKHSFELLKSKLNRFGFIFGDVIKREACMVLRPRGLFDVCCGKDNVFLVGEAAGFISPSSLEGISYAFESACVLGELLNAEKTGKKTNINQAYFLGTFKIRMKLLVKNLKDPFMYMPILRYIIMKSGLKSISIIE